MAFRLLLIIALLLASVWLWRRIGRPPARGPAASSEPAAQALLRCRTCGVHVVETQVVRDAAGHTYCCPQHRDAQTDH